MGTLNLELWIGLANPKLITGEYAELNGMLSWSDGTGFTNPTTDEIPEAAFHSATFCAAWWLSFPAQANRIEAKQCSAYSSFVCEYECGNGKD